eukprot:gene17355-22902_t
MCLKSFLCLILMVYIEVISVKINTGKI